MKNSKHTQKYWKKENKKINRDNLTEITGNREQLKDLLGETFLAKCYITNSIAYFNTKRLVTEIQLPIKDSTDKTYYIKHVWCKMENIKLAPHGYDQLKMKVIRYINQETQETKYGLQCDDVRYKAYEDSSMKIPQWKLDQMENEEMKKESQKQKRREIQAQNEPKNVVKTKRLFGKIRKITVK